MCGLIKLTWFGLIPKSLGVCFIGLICIITGILIICLGIIVHDPKPKNPFNVEDVSEFTYHFLRLLIIVLAGIYLAIGLIIPVAVLLRSNCFECLSYVLGVATQLGIIITILVVLSCTFSERCVVKEELVNFAVGASFFFIVWFCFIGALQDYSCELNRRNWYMQCCELAAGVPFPNPFICQPVGQGKRCPEKLTPGQPCAGLGSPAQPSPAQPCPVQPHPEQPAAGQPYPAETCTDEQSFQRAKKEKKNWKTLQDEIERRRQSERSCKKKGKVKPKQKCKKQDKISLISEKVSKSLSKKYKDHIKKFGTTKKDDTKKECQSVKSDSQQCIVVSEEDFMRLSKPYQRKIQQAAKNSELCVLVPPQTNSEPIAENEAAIAKFDEPTEAYKKLLSELNTIATAYDVKEESGLSTSISVHTVINTSDQCTKDICKKFLCKGLLITSSPTKGPSTLDSLETATDTFTSNSELKKSSSQLFTESIEKELKTNISRLPYVSPFTKLTHKYLEKLKRNDDQLFEEQKREEIIEHGLNNLLGTFLKALRIQPKEVYSYRSKMPVCKPIGTHLTRTFVGSSSIDSKFSGFQSSDITENDSQSLAKDSSFRIKCMQAKDLLARKFFKGMESNKDSDDDLNYKKRKQDSCDTKPKKDLTCCDADQSQDEEECEDDPPVSEFCRAYLAKRKKEKKPSQCQTPKKEKTKKKCKKPTKMKSISRYCVQKVKKRLSMSSNESACSGEPPCRPVKLKKLCCSGASSFQEQPEPRSCCKHCAEKDNASLRKSEDSEKSTKDVSTDSSGLEVCPPSNKPKDDNAKELYRSPDKRALNVRRTNDSRQLPNSNDSAHKPAERSHDIKPHSAETKSHPDKYNKNTQRVPDSMRMTDDSSTSEASLKERPFDVKAKTMDTLPHAHESSRETHRIQDSTRRNDMKDSKSNVKEEGNKRIHKMPADMRQIPKDEINKPQGQTPRDQVRYLSNPKERPRDTKSNVDAKPYMEEVPRDMRYRSPHKLSEDVKKPSSDDSMQSLLEKTNDRSESKIMEPCDQKSSDTSQRIPSSASESDSNNELNSSPKTDKSRRSLSSNSDIDRHRSSGNYSENDMSKSCEQQRTLQKRGYSSDHSQNVKRRFRRRVNSGSSGCECPPLPLDHPSISQENVKGSINVKNKRLSNSFQGGSPSRRQMNKITIIKTRYVPNNSPMRKQKYLDWERKAPFRDKNTNFTELRHASQTAINLRSENFELLRNRVGDTPTTQNHSYKKEEQQQQESLSDSQESIYDKQCKSKKAFSTKLLPEQKIKKNKSKENWVSPNQQYSKKEEEHILLDSQEDLNRHPTHKKINKQEKYKLESENDQFERYNPNMKPQLNKKVYSCSQESFQTFSNDSAKQKQYNLVSSTSYDSVENTNCKGRRISNEQLQSCEDLLLYCNENTKIKLQSASNDEQEQRAKITEPEDIAKRQRMDSFESKHPFKGGSCSVSSCDDNEQKLLSRSRRSSQSDSQDVDESLSNHNEDSKIKLKSGSTKEDLQQLHNVTESETSLGSQRGLEERHFKETFVRKNCFSSGSNDSAVNVISSSQCDLKSKSDDMVDKLSDSQENMNTKYKCAPKRDNSEQKRYAPENENNEKRQKCNYQTQSQESISNFRGNHANYKAKSENSTRRQIRDTYISSSSNDSERNITPRQRRDSDDILLNSPENHRTIKSVPQRELKELEKKRDAQKRNTFERQNPQGNLQENTEISMKSQPCGQLRSRDSSKRPHYVSSSDNTDENKQIGRPKRHACNESKDMGERHVDNQEYSTMKVKRTPMKEKMEQENNSLRSEHDSEEHKCDTTRLLQEDTENFSHNPSKKIEPCGDAMRRQTQRTYASVGCNDNKQKNIAPSKNDSMSESHESGEMLSESQEIMNNKFKSAGEQKEQKSNSSPSKNTENQENHIEGSSKRGTHEKYHSSGKNQSEEKVMTEPRRACRGESQSKDKTHLDSQENDKMEFRSVHKKENLEKYSSGAGNEGATKTQKYDPQKQNQESVLKSDSKENAQDNQQLLSDTEENTEITSRNVPKKEVIKHNKTDKHLETGQNSSQVSKEIKDSNSDSHDSSHSLSKCASSKGENVPAGKEVSSVSQNVKHRQEIIVANSNESISLRQIRDSNIALHSMKNTYAKRQFNARQTKIKCDYSNNKRESKDMVKGSNKDTSKKQRHEFNKLQETLSDSQSDLNINQKTLDKSKNVSKKEKELEKLVSNGKKYTSTKSKRDSSEESNVEENLYDHLENNKEKTKTALAKVKKYDSSKVKKNKTLTNPKRESTRETQQARATLSDINDNRTDDKSKNISKKNKHEDEDQVLESKKYTFTRPRRDSIREFQESGDTPANRQQYHKAKSISLSKRGNTEEESNMKDRKQYTVTKQTEDSLTYGVENCMDKSTKDKKEDDGRRQITDLKNFTVSRQKRELSRESQKTERAHLDNLNTKTKSKKVKENADFKKNNNSKGSKGKELKKTESQSDNQFKTSTKSKATSNKSKQGEENTTENKKDNTASPNLEFSQETQIAKVLSGSETTTTKTKSESHKEKQKQERIITKTDENTASYHSVKQPQEIIDICLETRENVEECWADSEKSALKNPRPESKKEGEEEIFFENQEISENNVKPTIPSKKDKRDEEYSIASSDKGHAKKPKYDAKREGKDKLHPMTDIQENNKNEPQQKIAASKKEPSENAVSKLKRVFMRRTRNSKKERLEQVQLLIDYQNNTVRRSRRASTQKQNMESESYSDSSEYNSPFTKEKHVYKQHE